MMQLLKDVKSNLINQEIINENENYMRFTLELFTKNNFYDFSSKQYSLSLIYLELCNLFQISPQEYEMKIIKVESGSMLSDLFGHKIIIQLISELIKKTIDYYYRNFTKEGKIVSLPKKVEVVEKFIGLKNELEKVGIDTSDLSAHIQKASIGIAKNLEKLLYKEPKVKLQGELIELAEYYQEKYLDQSKIYFLEENSNKEKEIIKDIKNIDTNDIV